jgi:hypothetical protein
MLCRYATEHSPLSTAYAHGHVAAHKTFIWGTADVFVGAVPTSQGCAGPPSFPVGILRPFVLHGQLALSAAVGTWLLYVSWVSEHNAAFWVTKAIYLNVCMRITGIELCLVIT